MSLRLLAALLFFVLSFPALLFAFEGTCVHVGDGDTIIVDTGTEKYTIRLIGIDAPEIAHYGKAGQEPWGTAAKKYLASLILGKEVRVEHDTTERDKYGRYLGYIYIGDIFVNEALVRDGHALAFTVQPNTRYRSRFESAEAEAKAKGLGIWDRANPLREKPVDFRHTTNREDNVYKYVKPTRFKYRHHSAPHPHHTSTRTSTRTKDAAETPKGKIIGNKNSKIYHVPGQENYHKTGSANRVYFESEQEAIDAGYRKAKR